jgi:hypothetical protein
MAKKPKVLIWDLENSYIIREDKVWNLFDDDPISREVKLDWQILSIGWKWKGEKKVHVLGQDDFADYVPGQLNDKSLLEAFWEVINLADIEVSHNGDRHDMKKLNARMMIHGLKPYSPVLQYDTLKAFKRVSGHTSNKLSYLAEKHGTHYKGDAGGVDTWTGCMNGDPKAWKKLKGYNKLDINPLDDIFDTITLWDKQAPKMNVYGDNDGCTRCGSPNVVDSHLDKANAAGNRKMRAKCNDCGKWQYSKKTEKIPVLFT